MGPDSELEAIRAEFPDWDITRIFGGYRAVPRGTVVLEGIYLDSLAKKLKEQGHDDGN
jgi:hypothetical protein